MTFASDYFIGTDSTELAAYSANWVEHGYNPSGTALLQANRVRSTANFNWAVYYHTASPASADYEVSANIFVVDTSYQNIYGVAARIDTASNNWYAARFRRPSSGTSAAFQLFKVINGTWIQLGADHSITHAANEIYNIKLRVNGTTISVFKNGESTPIIEQTDSAITAAGKAGIAIYAETPGATVGLRLDDFVAADYPLTAAVIGAPVGLASVGLRPIGTGIAAAAGGGPQADSVAYAAGAGDQFAAQLKLAGTFTSDAGAGDAVSATTLAHAITELAAGAADQVDATLALPATVSYDAGAGDEQAAAAVLAALLDAAAGAADEFTAALGLEARYARPIADNVVGAWQSTAATLYEAIDEETRADADYIYTTAASTCRLQLTSCSDPGATPHRISLAVPAGFSPSGTLTVKLYSADLLIATWAIGTPTADTVYPLDLTEGERDSITDYTDLELELVAA